MSIIKIAIGVFLGLALTTVVVIGGTTYMANSANTGAKDYGRCLALQGYAEGLIKAKLFDLKRPAPPTALSSEDRTFAQDTVARVLAEQDAASGGKAVPSAGLIARANEILCE